MGDKSGYGENPQKAESRLHINSFLMGSLFTVLSIIWAFGSGKINQYMVLQMVLAIPLILFASLSYAKMGYGRSHSIWDKFGWFTNNLGYILFLNATGLMVLAFASKVFAVLYFVSVLILVSVYYMFNIITQPGTFREHVSKWIFYIILISIGGLVFLF
ncbi:MAG: hypothetical protein WCK90_00045 [archaeon]